MILDLSNLSTYQIGAYFPIRAFTYTAAPVAGKGKAAAGLGGRRHLAQKMLAALMAIERQRSLLDTRRGEALRRLASVKRERDFAREQQIIAERQGRIISSLAVLFAEI